MLPSDVEDALRPHLDGPVRRAASVGGGCIAHATRVETDRTVCFLKWSRDEVAKTFVPEAAGLRALRAAASPLFVPEVLAVRPAQAGEPGFLLLEWIEPGRRGDRFSDRLGRGLAALHRREGDAYGFSEDNFIGRLPQENAPLDAWPAFFHRRRLEPQVERARAGGRWRGGWNDAYGRLVDRLPELLAERPPASLLHGDLWSGNVMAAADERPALVDPAVYHGHREADLAMTELFGGFDARFYAAYREAWPLEPGYEDRREIYNLYHLVNHLNHFGETYASGVERVLRRFG